MGRSGLRPVFSIDGIRRPVGVLWDDKMMRCRLNVTTQAHNLKRILTAALLCSAVPSGAADLAAGKAKAEAVCQTCHGLNGRGIMAMVANIGGQQKQYLVKQLSDYRSGKRQHEQMSIIAGMLTEQDVDNVAEWYSSIVANFEIPE
jgi:cytochrome c553